MLLPSKLYAFNESSLALFAPILEKLANGPTMPVNLARELDISVNQLEHALGALYALRAIDLNDKGDVYSCL